MAKKKNNALAKGAILLVVVGVPAVFALAVFGTGAIMDTVPYVGVAIIAIIAGLYTGYTCHLLYDYFETKTPFDAYLPCVGELSMMDSKFKLPGYIMYALAIVFLGLSQLPYSVFSFMGQRAALGMPVYLLIACFVCLGVVQVIKGVGIMGLMKSIDDEWQEKMHGTLGFIKSFSWLGFIPFVRVVATYGLNKPLSTLVSFNGVSVSDTDDIDLEEA